MPDAGSVIAGYRVVRVLGSGGMGSVYLAQDPDLPRLDALKVLSSARSNDPEFRARFVREAAVAAGLSHPNIVAIHRRGETAEGQLWIAMQFVDGDDADAALRAGTMTPQRAVRIVGEVAKALDYAHRHNVVHRDVKPANFLLTAQGGAAERVLLADFGIARALDDVGLTTTGSVLATMSYAAPEVLAGHALDGRADIYSLGCSLFRLLTGVTPFPTGNGPAAVMMAHLHAPPPRVSERVPDLSSALDAVIARAMAKDPAGRFPTATELAESAHNALRDAPPGVLRTALPSRMVDIAQAADSGWWRPASSGQFAPTAQALRGNSGQRRRRSRWVAAGLAITTAVVAAAASLIFSGRGERAGAPPTLKPAPTSLSAPATPTLVSPAGLPGLLLKADALAVPLGTGHMQTTDTSTALLDSSAEVSDNQCVSAWAPAQVAAYARFGSSGAQVQTLSDGLEPAQRTTITQAVIAFPTPDAADNAVAAQTSQWQQCANRTITVTTPGSGATAVTLGAPVGVPGMIQVLSQQVQPTPGQHCQRATGSKNNVVVDIAACTPSVQDPAKEVARLISGDVPVG
jgi:eukaryotic-like serine/threonine-protein kinase